MSAQSFRAGVRVGLGLAVPTFVLALTFGAMARSLGWGTLAPIVCSAVVFAGSAQFAAATALAGGGGIALAAGAAALINARFIPMGAAAAASFRGGRLRRAVEAQALVDGSWAAAHLGDGRFDRAKMIAATLMQWPAWTGGTALGALLAPPPDMLDRWGLDLVFPAFFLVLLLDELRAGRLALVAAATGAVLAAGLALVVPAGVALLGSAVGALIGLWGGRRGNSVDHDSRADRDHRGDQGGRAGTARRP